jgi:hypothetical protein
MSGGDSPHDRRIGAQWVTSHRRHDRLRGLRRYRSDELSFVGNV